MPLREDLAGSPGPTASTNAERKAVWIREDHLSVEIGPHLGSRPGEVDILLAESMEDASRLPFHKKKLILRFSAMRHFARDLSRQGHRVFYYAEEESAASALRDFSGRRGAGELVLFDSGHDAGAQTAAKQARAAEFRPSIESLRGSLVPLDRFQAWLEPLPSPSAGQFVESFATDMGMRPLPTPKRRTATAPPPSIPPLPIFPRDSITREVVELVDRRFAGNFGTGEGFNLPVTRPQVMELVEHFLVERLPLWAADENRPAMSAGEPFLCQSIIDPYLALGLVSPAELVARVRDGVSSGEVLPGPAAIFLEKVLAVREFLTLLGRARPATEEPADPFGHRQPLPAFLSANQLPMYCLSDTMKQIRHHGFAPNSQRNLLVGNLLVIAETDPKLVQEWCDAAFLDSAHRPVRPSLLDGPTNGGGNGDELLPDSPTREICDHSNYCHHCNYDPDQLAGEDACPYNPLFWDFLERNREKVREVPRLAASLKILDSFEPEVRRQIREAAGEVREAFVGLRPNPKGA